MDTPTSPAASNNRASTPLMPEKEAGKGTARSSRAETLTVVSTHDSGNGHKYDEEKNNEKATITNTEPADESRILTGRKLVLVFVYVAYHLSISTPLILYPVTAVSSSPFS